MVLTAALKSLGTSKLKQFLFVPYPASLTPVGPLNVIVVHDPLE